MREESIRNKNMLYSRALEHFQKYYNHLEEWRHGAVLLGFGIVSAQSQGFFEPAPSSKPRQNPKILAPNGYSIFENAPGTGLSVFET
jgi:hypothetical protein